MMTHEYTIDHRFDEVHSRMLSEFLWDSIVFEGRASIDTFLAEVKTSWLYRYCYSPILVYRRSNFTLCK